MPYHGKCSVFSAKKSLTGQQWIFMQLTAELEAQALEHHDVEMKKSENDHGLIKPEFRFNRRYLCVCVGYLMAAAAEGPTKLTEMYDYAMN